MKILGRKRSRPQRRLTGDLNRVNRERKNQRKRKKSLSGKTAWESTFPARAFGHLVARLPAAMARNACRGTLKAKGTRRRDGGRLIHLDLFLPPFDGKLLGPLAFLFSTEREASSRPLGLRVGYGILATTVGLISIVSR